MDFLNNAYSQVVELFRGMTPTARITTALLLAVLVVSFVVIIRQSGDEADTFLFGGEILTQSEIALMEAAFAKKALGGWEQVGNRVKIPRGQRSAFLVALAEENAFPDTPTSAWTRMFREDNPLKSKHIRQLEEMRAIEQSLARTIEEISGIDVARLQIQEVDKGDFPRVRERRALVSAKATGNDPLEARLVETIRNMVNGGGGVDRQNVTVTDLNTGRGYPGVGEDGMTMDNLYVKHQRALEDNLKEKITDRLSMYPGVKVAVHVELDQEVVNQTVSNKYDPKPTTVDLTDYSKEIQSTQPEVGGRPGAVPNASISNVPQQISQVAAAESTTTERRENQRSVTGSTRIVTEKLPFSPTRMCASIGIPRSYFTQVWRQRPGADAAAEPDPAQLEAVETEIVTDIEEAVNTLLPQVAQGEDPFPRVNVVPYTETPLPAPEAPSMADSAATWLSYNWQTLGLIVLAAGSVFVLRGMIRSAQPTPPPASEQALPVERLAELEEEEEQEQAELANSLRARFQSSERSLRDELTELVREDPDAAANVLQVWIGDAA